VSDDLQWRRPVGGQAGGEVGRDRPDAAAEPAGASTVPAYQGPPRSTPPPAEWRPRTLIQVPAPRVLPAQDTAALDAEEKAARTTTYGVGMVAGAVLLIVLFVLCGRALF
jgi:hypothetical protein